MSNLSLGGLATGMDTQSIIDQLVQLEQRPIVNYQREISELEETKGAWRDVNGRLDKLENRATDLKLSATYNSRNTSSSNEDVVTATASNSSDEANYSVTVHSTARAQRVAGSRLDDTGIAISELDGFAGIAEDNVITINEQEITINSSDSLRDISNKINDADAGVKASIVDNHLVMETTETGEANALIVGDTLVDSNGILESLGILDAGNIANELQAASDAVVDINGITGITSSTNTFSDVVEGVTFKIDPDAVANDGLDTAFSSVSVTKDTGKAVDAVQAFVDQYNSVMNFLDGKTEYDEEEEKGAILQGDSTAMRLQMRLRELVTSKVKDDGEYRALSSIGIEIDRDGVMSFDSSKFTEALNDSPEEVTGLFRADSESDGYDGMAQRMNTYLDQLLHSNTGIIPRRLDFFDNRIDGLNDDIESVQRKVEMTRERYIRQFTAMEEAISQMQSQQSWMMSQLQGLGNTNFNDSLSGN